MRTHLSTLRSFLSVALAGFARAHAGPFHPAMYCVNGTTRGVVDPNNNAPVMPLFQLNHNEYWMHQTNNCDMFPPEPGVFLELPAGKNFTLELADNRAHTTLNRNAVLTDWGDGLEHPDDYNNPHCITQPNLHTQNRSMAAGTALAIAYKSNIHDVTLDDLVVFTVRYHTPWKRVTSYDVPKGMPPCPKDGCTCVWGWIPQGCGEPNMYMFPIRCNVTPGSTPSKTIGTPKAPVWCEDDQERCVRGPKQFMIWNQREGNNIEVSGLASNGLPKSPAYNDKCGFRDGAQNDIFVEADGSETASSTSVLPVSSTRATQESAGAHSKRMMRQRGHSIL